MNAGAGRGGSGKAGFQPFTERHQGINLGHDAMLFGEGWDHDRKRLQLSLLRDGLLNETLFLSLHHTRITLAACHQDDTPNYLSRVSAGKHQTSSP